MSGVIDESRWWAPGPGLRPFVSWCSGFRQAGVAARRHRGLPSPDLTFILTLDDPLVIAGHPDPRQPGGSYESLIGGLHTAPALITHDGRQSGIQLGVTPLGARALFGLPAGELANLDVEAAQVVGEFAAEVRDRVRAERTWVERPPPEHAVQRGVRAVTEGGGPGVPVRRRPAAARPRGQHGRDRRDRRDGCGPGRRAAA